MMQYVEIQYVKFIFTEKGQISCLVEAHKMENRNFFLVPMGTKKSSSVSLKG